MSEESEEKASYPDLLDLDRLRTLLPQAADVDFWRGLVPDLELSDDPFAALRANAAASPPAEAGDWLDQLVEEGYFQTGPILAERHRRDMLRAVEAVREAGFPAAFALVYDVFYRSFESFDPVLRRILGGSYRFLPNSWIYYVAPSDHNYGAGYHRDTEYPDTIREDGLPTVINAWIALTEALPINGCMYMLPADRDPDYERIVRWSREGDRRYKDNTPPKDLDFRNLRAIPAAAGSVSMWNQYVFHWGGRGSRRAPGPRVSMATYFQRGDIAPVDPATVDISQPLPFAARLGIILRATLRYTNAWYDRDKADDPLVVFARPYIEALEKIS